MPTRRDKTQLDLECICNHPEHMQRWYYDDDNLTMTFHLASQGFFRRLISGIKYIFGYKSKYGCFDEMILNCEDAKTIGAFLGDYLRLNKYTVVHYVFDESETIGECEND